MGYVNCPYCGEQYNDNEKVCPLCGAENDNYIDATADTDKSGCSSSNITCPCCGEVYDVELKQCPLCNYENEFYPHQEYDSCSAMLIEEESDYVPPKRDRKPVPKQNAPDKNLVLVAFIGVIFIVIVLFIKAISGIAGSASSRIGAELFESQEYNTQQNE